MPGQVSIGQMRGTTGSSCTLLNVKDPPVIRKACLSNNLGHCCWPRNTGSAVWSRPIVLLPVLLAFLCCGPSQSSAQRLPGPPRSASEPRNSIADSGNNDVNKIYTDEFEQVIKTTRFRANDGESPPGMRKQGVGPPDSYGNYGGGGGGVNKVNTDRVRGWNSGYNEDNNNDVAAFPAKDERTLENNDVQKIGLNSQALRTFAGEVADSILAGGDKLFAMMETGSPLPQELTSQNQLVSRSSPPSSDTVRNYVIC